MKLFPLLSEFWNYVAINDVLPLKATRRDAIANLKWCLGPRTPETYFCGYNYIQYAAPPYSARISAIYVIPFGKVWLGSVSRVQRVPTKQNAEFTDGGWELRFYLKPFVDQSSRNL